MRKKSFLLIVLLILCAQLVCSETLEVSVKEGQLLNISEKLKIFDPEGGPLNVSFSAPLDGEGLWQTNYYNAGTYYTNITASDGVFVTVQPVKIIVSNVNRKPHIDVVMPKDLSITINELKSLNFSVKASDPDKDKLYYSWKLDSEELSAGPIFVYYTNYYSAGVHNVKLTVSDGDLKVYKDWEVNVLNTNAPPSLDYLGDLVFDEGDTVTIPLNASDIDGDNISYFLTSPLNNNGRWNTGFDDAGEYFVNVTASDGELSATKTIKLAVKNKDRPAIITSASPKDDRLSMSEGESISFEVSAFDADGDDLSYRWVVNEKDVDVGKSFVFSPGFGSAGAHTVEVVVDDGTVSVSKEWLVIVKDVNQAPVLQKLGDISTKEGDTLIVKVNASDPDGDSVKISFSKPFDEFGVWKTGFDDAGDYFVTVTASDGELSSFEVFKVVVENVDRPLIFKDISPIIVSEGDEVKFRPSVLDLDDDIINVVAYGLPDGAVFDGKEFSWTPGFDVADRNTGWFGKFLSKVYLYDFFFSDSKKFSIVFGAESGNYTINKTLNVVVNDKNRAPILSGVSDVYTVLESEKVNVNVSAFDPDNDSLSTSFSKPLSKRGEWMTTYSDAGVYNSSVSVSDGDLVSTKVFTINVRDNNRPPVIYVGDSFKFKEGDTVRFDAKAVDLDEDNVTLSYSGWMKSAEYNTTENDSGIHTVTITASDGKDSSSKEVSVFVKDVKKIDWSVVWFYAKYVLLGILILLILIFFINWFEKKNALEKPKREAKKRLGKNRFKKVKELMGIK